MVAALGYLRRPRDSKSRISTFAGFTYERCPARRPTVNEDADLKADVVEVHTWTTKVCKIIAFMAIFTSLGPLCCMLLGFR